MTICENANIKANKFMTNFAEYIMWIFDTVESYLHECAKTKSDYDSDSYGLPVTRMTYASLDDADTFTKLDQKLFSASMIYTVAWCNPDDMSEYGFCFSCNDATIKVSTRKDVFSMLWSYIIIKHPNTKRSIVPQDTIRFNAYSTFNTAFERNVIQLENIIWVSLMLGDIDMLSDLMMFVNCSNVVITDVVSRILGKPDDEIISTKIQAEKTINALRNRTDTAVSIAINKWRCGLE